MRRPKLKPHLSLKEIKQRMKSSKDKREYRRWQAMYLIEKKGMNAEEIGEVVDVCPHTVHQWVYYYNKKGPAGLTIKGQRGGNRALMTRKEEIILLEGIEREASQGLIVTTKVIKQKVEEKLKRSVSKDYPYDLLHRHGWKKSTAKTQESQKTSGNKKGLKKNLQSCWQPVRKFI